MRATVRKVHRMSVVLLAACLILANCVPAGAAEILTPADRTYTVRFFSGQRGVIDQGQEMVSVRKKDGERIERDDFYALTRVSVTDEKYYVKGIRESGKDFKEDEEKMEVDNANPSFEVHQDIDFVVSYGILGDSVAYTINYLDQNGNKLIDSETYYGNIGDQPVVAYQYIAGWLPQAYNLTRTLSANAADNVFDFIYTRVASAEANPAPGGGEAAGGAGAEGGGGTAAGEEGGEAGGGGAGDEGAGGGETADIPDEAAPQGGSPEDLVNIDDQETPLSNLTDTIKKILDPEGNGVLVKAARPVAGVGLAALLLFLFFVYKRRKKEKEETETNG